jgi:hypothetical protein
MTKEMLIQLMEDWPNETIVEISAWPFMCYIKGVYLDPKTGRGYVTTPPEWYMREEFAQSS